MTLVRTYDLLEAKIDLVDWKQWEDEGTQSVSQSAQLPVNVPACLHLSHAACLCLFWKEGLWLPNRWANKEVSAQPPLNQPQCFFGEFFSRTRAPSWQHQQQLKPIFITLTQTCCSFLWLVFRKYPQSGKFHCFYRGVSGFQKLGGGGAEGART